MTVSPRGACAPILRLHPRLWGPSWSLTQTLVGNELFPTLSPLSEDIVFLNRQASWMWINKPDFLLGFHHSPGMCSFCRGSESAASLPPAEGQAEDRLKTSTSVSGRSLPWCPDTPGSRRGVSREN